MNILDRIVLTKREEIRALMPLRAEVERSARAAPPPRDLRDALRSASREVAIIAEVKRRSPGAGPIREDLDPAGLAAEYARSGAAAMSVLTDRDYFGGSLHDLRRVRARVRRPLLRKDFVVHPLQLAESRGAGADAVLLIVRILEDPLLGELLSGARELGMAALVETHDAAELDRALKAGADVVGINNRDLSTFRSSVAVTLELLPDIPADVVVVSESGLATRQDLADVGAAGADAVLMGEALLRSPRPGEALAGLTGVPRGPRRPAPGGPGCDPDLRQPGGGSGPLPEVKICGITRPPDGRMAAEAGATYVGAVLTPGFSRSVDLSTARAVADAARVPLVILLVDPTLEEAVAAARETGASVVQLHGAESPDTVARLSASGPWKVWKAAAVRGAADAEAALERYGEAADALLFDGWHPKLPGGTGTRFPWGSLAGIRDRFTPGQRFVAAGGLNPDNVGEAVSILRPDVVDASSGVESSVGVKDARKVRRFVRAAQFAGGDS